MRRAAPDLVEATSPQSQSRVVDSEDRGAGDEEGAPAAAIGPAVAGVDATVYLQQGVADQRASRRVDLVRGGLDEGLAAPAGVDGHAEDEVGDASSARRRPRPEFRG